MRALKTDAMHTIIGLLERFLKRSATGCHSEHTAARRDELAVLQGCPRMIDGRAGDLAALIQALDRDPLRVGFWISARGHNNAGTGVFFPCDLLLCEPAVHHRFHDINQSAFQRGRTTCVSGSPKRALYSMTFGPAGVSIRPKYKQPLKGLPSCRIARMVGRKISSMQRAAISGV